MNFPFVWNFTYTDIFWIDIIVSILTYRVSIILYFLVVGGSDSFVVFWSGVPILLIVLLLVVSKNSVIFLLFVLSSFVLKRRFVFVIYCFKYFTLPQSDRIIFFWKSVGSLFSHRKIWSLGGGSAFPETFFRHRCCRGMLSSRIGDTIPRNGVLILMRWFILSTLFRWN